MKQRTKANLKENKAITLIALVITIIVLIILAGVSINLILGENGIIAKAKQASKTTKDVTEDEQVKLAVADALIKGTGTLSTDDLEKALQNEFGEDKVKDNLTGNGPWTFKGERKNYTINVAGTVEEAGPPVAKDILTVNPAGVEPYEKSPYVKYNNIICRVLYNDEAHGIQIISSESVENVALGYKDTNENVTAENFDKDTENNFVDTDDDFKKAACSYNRAVDSLNEKAEEYLLESDKTSPKKIAIDARCVGSLATLESGKFQKNVDEKMLMNFTDRTFAKSKWPGVLKDSDNNFEEDIGEDIGNEGQLQKLDLAKGVSCWLASRKIKDDTTVWFQVRYINDYWRRGVCFRYL